MTTKEAQLVCKLCAIQKRWFTVVDDSRGKNRMYDHLIIHHGLTYLEKQRNQEKRA